MSTRKQPVTTKPLDELDALRLEKLRMQEQLLQVQHAFVQMQRIDYERQLEEKQNVRGWNLDLNTRLWTKPNLKAEEN